MLGSDVLTSHAGATGAGSRPVRREAAELTNRAPLILSVLHTQKNIRTANGLQPVEHRHVYAALESCVVSRNRGPTRTGYPARHRRPRHEAEPISVRLHHGGPQGAKPKGEVVAEILADIKERK